MESFINAILKNKYTDGTLNPPFVFVLSGSYNKSNFQSYDWFNPFATGTSGGNRGGIRKRAELQGCGRAGVEPYRRAADTSHALFDRLCR